MSVAARPCVIGGSALIASSLIARHSGRGAARSAPRFDADCAAGRRRSALLGDLGLAPFEPFR